MSAIQDIMYDDFKAKITGSDRIPHNFDWGDVDEESNEKEPEGSCIGDQLYVTLSK